MFSATKSPYAEHINEYVKAQRIGEGMEVPGECFPYFKGCPKSLFKSNTQNHKYKYRNFEHFIQIFIYTLK